MMSGGNWTCLKSTAERADGAFSGVRTKPRRMPPSDIAIAAGDDAMASHCQFYQPLVRKHLPHHKATFLCYAAAGSSSTAAAGGRADFIRHLHPQFPRRKYVLHPPFQLPASRSRHEMLYDILRRRRNLPKEFRSRAKKNVE